MILHSELTYLSSHFEQFIFEKKKRKKMFLKIYMMQGKPLGRLKSKSSELNVVITGFIELLRDGK